MASTERGRRATRALVLALVMTTAGLGTGWLTAGSAAAASESAPSVVSTIAAAPVAVASAHAAQVLPPGDPAAEGNTDVAADATPAQQWAYFRALDAQRVAAQRAHDALVDRMSPGGSLGLPFPGHGGYEVLPTVFAGAGGVAAGAGAQTAPMAVSGRGVLPDDSTARTVVPRAESSMDDSRLVTVDTHPD